MRLQIKILLVIIPICIIAISTLGFWATITTTKSIQKSMYDFMELELDSYIDRKVMGLYKILEKNGLTGVESYVKNYQDQALAAIEDFNFTKTSHLTIFDKTGRLIFCSRGHTQISDPLWEPIVKNIRLQPTDDLKGNVNTPAGEEMYIGKTFEPWEWVVVYSISTDEVNSSVAKIRFATIGVTLLCVLGGLISIILVLRHFFVQPVSYLKTVAEDIANQKNIDRININSKDELGVLARSMERMARSIKDYRVEQENWQSHLEQEIEARTKDLNETNLALKNEIAVRKNSENKLINAQQEAEAASEAKSRFLSTMSHEIRTPMNAIIGMAEALSETELDSDQKKLVEMSRIAGHDLMVIINDILDLSKIEASKLELEKASFNLKDMVRETCDILNIRAQKNGLNLITDISPNIPPVVIGDALRLRQILTNLISNSIKFTEKGYVSLDVRERSKSKAQSNGSMEILFSVADTGIGIPKNRLKTIFDTFTQVDSSTTRKYGGTGLGLAISKRMAEMMGGRIRVSSRQGKGSRFTFNAKFEVQSDKVIVTEGMPRNPDNLPLLPNPVNKSSYRLLVVEDSNLNQNLLLHYLKKYPIAVDIAENGKMALEKFKSASYDLVLMDMQMPVMDGFSSTKHIRKWEKENNLEPTPIIAMTAYAFTEDKDKTIMAGCTDYLSKPMNKASFYDMIWKYLKGLDKTSFVKPDYGLHGSHVSQVDKQMKNPDKIHVSIDPVLRPFAQKFLTILNEDISNMQDYLEKKNFGKIREIAHQIKGDGGTYGFDNISQLGALIQSGAEDNNGKMIKKLVVQLYHYVDNIEMDADIK